MLAWVFASLVGLAACLLAGRPWRRAAALGVATLALFAAAIDARVGRDRPPRVAVLVDLSPSTRGLPFRDRATVEAIARRLAPDATLEFLAFADDVRPLGDGREIDAPRTRLPAVDADATLLFSDGRFLAMTPATPTFPILFDERAGDARIVDARIDRDRTIATVANAGGPRTLTWPDGSTTSIGRGTVDVVGPSGAGTLSLDAGDAWPENDRLDVAAAPASDERWWIGDAAPAGYRSIATLPPLDAMLSARLVVLNDASADAIGAAGRATLARYVRDLGGAVLILGGPRAFGAGGYAGTELDAISPLASVPPRPRDDWYVLVDASGSMATAAVDGRSRLDVAAQAAAAIDATLPPAAQVIAGSVARDVRWWPANGERRIAPPGDLAAGGPTNLDAAIDAVATRAAGSDRPSRLLLISDGQAAFADVDATIARCRAARLSVDWLALGDGPLSRIVAGTGGVRVDAGAPAAWVDRARAAASSAQATPMRDGPIVVRRGGESITVDAANTTFPRDGVEPLATDGEGTLAARWDVGLGRVTAVAFAPPGDWVEAFARDVERSPRDANLATRWSADAVTIETRDAAPLDRPTLTIDGRATPLEAIAPGRYRAPLPRRHTATLAVLTAGGGRVDVRSLPGRYDAEFDAIGVDRASLERVAAVSGGRVVQADEVGPIAELPRPRKSTSLRGWLLGAGLIALCVALLGRRETASS